MKNLFSLTLIIILLSGCYATTDENFKRYTASLKTDTISGIPNAAFDKYFKASDDFFRLYLKPSGFNGSMLVAKNGKIVYEKYNGLKRFDQSDSIDAETSFHLASISKTFTAMAICKLWQEGKIDIDKEASNYLPGFNFSGITVRSLLCHRSGLPNYVHLMEQRGTSSAQMISNRDVLNYLIINKKHLPVLPPNRSFHYCNTNYVLLALIIENMTDLPYKDYLEDSFFIPLKMKNTFVFTPEMKEKVIPSYNWKKQKEPYTVLDGIYGDKNIYSTPRDLLKWDMALSNGVLFKPEILESAFKGYSFEKQGVKNYGLGWRLYLYPDKKIVYHNGWWHGNNTVFARLVDDSATVIVLGNKYNRKIYDAKKLYASFGNIPEDLEEDE